MTASDNASHDPPGIRRERASVVCVAEGKLLAVALEDPTTRQTQVYLPGGAIEAEETPAAAAVREALEETGFAVVVDTARARVLHYPFVWDGRTYDCVTHFLPARLAAPDLAPADVDDADYHRGVEWVPLGKVRERFGYHAGILAEILALLPKGEA